MFVGKSQRSRQTAHATCTVAAVLLKGLSVCLSVCLYGALSSGTRVLLKHIAHSKFG
jgi:uncharacterized membrane protein